jgi:hypothetical protein
MWREQRIQGNHWLKNNVYGRCKKCVRKGRFQVTDPDQSFAGQPKPPNHILFERGWLNPDTPEIYTPSGIGEIVMDQKDSELLLDNFEIAGHHGYGGLNEGLCGGMPGCIERKNRKECIGYWLQKDTLLLCRSSKETLKNTQARMPQAQELTQPRKAVNPTSL